MSAKHWASAAADSDLNTLDTLLERLPVNLIATHRADLKVCTLEETVVDVRARNKEGYDHFPVVNTGVANRNAIVGLLDVTLNANCDASLLVSEVMRPLAEENLIGSDASILAFIRDADHHRCRLVVSGREISGLVSLSDIQRLPVRATLFAMITHLEATMAEAIRRRYDSVEAGIAKLSDPRKEETYRCAEGAKIHNAFVDMLLCTQFCDKVTMVKKHKDFTWSKREFEVDLKEIQKLRDNVAHANDYGATSAMAEQTCKTVRLMDKWIDRLAKWS